MRIAVSGTHRVGKTTLVERLGRALPGYVTVDEPYDRLVDEGYVFAAMPTVDDFQVQLERSIAVIAGSDPDTIFDRCPADILAYLMVGVMVQRDPAGFDPEQWLAQSADAMAELDLVVYLPIEEPDRIVSSDESGPDLRARVDDTLRELLFDRLEIRAERLEACGSLDDRVRQVLSCTGVSQNLR